jgi:hypothetical protein
MSESGKQFTGRPNTDQLETFRLLLYCGGGGGGGCILPLGVTGVVLKYRVQKFITYNRKIVIHNKEFQGVRIFEDAGSDGFCPNSLGTERSFWMGLAADPGLPVEATAKAGLELSGALPYDIEFPADLCPQPTDPAWENFVYVYIWWGSPLLMNESGLPDENALAIVKHDKDTKQ